MPVYKVKDRTFDIPEEKASRFESKYPDAVVDIYDAESGKQYGIPVSKVAGFKKKFPRWSYSAPSSENKSTDNRQRKTDNIQPATEIQIAELSGSKASLLPSSADQRPSTKDQPWQPSPAQKAEMAKTLEEADRTIAGMHEAAEKTGRIADSMTQQGRDRSKALRQTARQMGIETDPAGLLNPQTTENGKQTTENDQNSKSKIQNSTQGAQFYGLTRDSEGNIIPQWQMPDGSITTSFSEADRSVSAARQERLQNQFLKRMEENGLDPAKPQDVEEQRKKDLLDVAQKKVDIRLSENEKNIREIQDRKAQRFDESNSNQWDDNLGFWDNLARIIGGSVKRGVENSHPVNRSQNSLTEDERDIRTLTAENQVLDDARKLLETRRLKKSNGFMGGFWNIANNTRNMKMGATHSLSDPDLYAGGVMALQKATQLLDIEDKLKSGADLSDSEVSLVYSSMLGQDIMHNIETPHGYRAAQTTVEMFPFMAQMALNPASGLSQALVKNYGKNGLKKIALTVAGDVAESAVLVNTLQAPSTAADAISRYQGEVVDNNGKISFDGSHNWTESVAKTEGAAIIENYTEMLGNHFGVIGNAIGKAGNKALSKIGAGKIVDKVSDLVSKVNTTEWAKAIGDIEKRAQWNGVVGEVLEEESGIVLNSLFVGDNKFSDLVDVDQQIDIVLGVGLFGGFVSGIKSVGYPVARAKANSNLKKQENIAARRFGEEWDGIRSEIESADERDLSTLITGLVKKHAHSDEQAKTIIQYAHALMSARGYNLASASRVAEGNISPEQQDVEESFDHGADIAANGSPEEKNQTKLLMEQARERFVNSSSEDFVAEHFDSPDAVSNLLKLGYDDDLRQTALDYINARAAYEGMLQHVRDDIDGQISQSDAQIQSRVNRSSGSIHPAVIKDADADRPVFIIDGELHVADDGTIDHKKSQDSIIVRDAETGKLEFKTPADFLSVAAPLDPEAEMETARQQIRHQVARNAADAIDGVITMNPGDRYTILNTDGIPEEIEILGQSSLNSQPSTQPGQQTTENGQPSLDSVDILYPDGSIVYGIQVSDLTDQINGYRLQSVKDYINDQTNPLEEPANPVEDHTIPLEEPAIQSSADLERGANEVSATETVPNSAENDQIPVEMPQNLIETVPNDEISTDSQVAELSGSKAELLPPAPIVPLDENGDPDYDRAEPDTAWDALLRQTDGDEDIARSVIEQTVSEKEAYLKKLQKQKPKAGLSIKEKIQAEKDKKTALGAIQRSIDHWKAMGETTLRRQQAAEAEQQRIEAERLQEEARIEAERIAEEQRIEAERKEREKAEREEVAALKKIDRSYADVHAEVKEYPEAVGRLHQQLPEDILEAAALVLSTNKLLWGDNAGSKGTAAETGFKEGERKGLFSMFASREKGGKSIARLAEDEMKQVCDTHGIPYDNSAARDALIEIISQARIPSDITRFIRRRRIDQARQIAEGEQRREREAFEEWAWENYHMSADDFEAYQENRLQEIAFLDENFDANEYYGNIADELINYNFNQNETIHTGATQSYDSQGESGDIRGGDQILSPQQPDSSQGSQENAGGSRIPQKDGSDILHTSGTLVQDPSRTDSPITSTQILQPETGDPSGLERGGSEVSTPPLSSKIAEAEAQVNTDPTDRQKEAGNYKKGHVQVGAFDVTIENPKGSVRRGVDADGKKWETTMTHTYGYIRGTTGVDGDHIDVYISSDVDDWNGRKAFVVDQYNPDGSFDEHKVMLGFNDRDEAFSAYLSNYEEGWQNGRRLDVSAVNLEDFEKWIDSSKRKTKPFAEYKSVKANEDNTAVGRSLSEKEAADMIALMEANAEVAPEIELTIENWNAEFGENGTVETPIGIVKMGENQYLKMSQQGRNGKLGMIKPTLQSPNVIVEDFRPASSVESERDSSYIFVKTFTKDNGERYYHFTSVTVRKDGREVVISNQERTKNRISKLLQQGTITWINDDSLHPKAQVGKSVSLNDSNIPTNSDNGDALLGVNSSVDISSDSKVNTLPPDKQTDTEESSDGYTIEPRKDTRDNSDIFAVKFNDRVSREVFKGQKDIAKKHGGYWSNFGKKGFLFKSPEDAQAFANEVSGKTDTQLSEEAPLALSDLQLPSNTTSEATAADSTKKEKSSSNLERGASEVSTPAGQSRVAEPSGSKAQPLPPSEAPKPKSRWVDDEDAEEFARLRSILRNGLGQLNSGFPPELLYAGGKMSYLIMKHGVRKFADYASAMIEELGDAIRPHLKSLYNFTRSTEDVLSSDWADQLTPFDEVLRFDTANFLKDHVDAMATAAHVVAEEDSKTHILEAEQELKKKRSQNASHANPERGGNKVTTHTSSVNKGKKWDATGEPEKYKSGSKKKKSDSHDVIWYNLGNNRRQQIGSTVAERDSIETLIEEFGSVESVWNAFEDGNVFLNPNEAAIVKRIIEKSEEPKNRKSQKKAVSSRDEQPGFFGGLFSDNVTPTDNDIRRNDAGSTERLPSDNRGQSEGDRGNQGAQSQGARQESERTDRAREESGTERTRTLSPRLSRLTDKERKNTRNNRAERGTDYAPKGEDARIKANIAAIELAQRLTESGEQATTEQMEILRKFSGWGGLGKAFSNDAYADRIRKLLGDSYQDAVDSRKSAYYTPAAIIDSLWDIAKAMGFQGGNILEGSAGIGNILGLMPEDISERSNVRAVEVDSTTGSILSLLYPDAQVDIQGFEETQIENGSVDLAITNVPFITGWNVIDKTGDKDLSKKFKDIHDFCIAKNIRKLREGGIGIFITSSGTLDNSAKLRAWVTNEGNSDVVGAFRLHNETFGGTGATSDIIVVRKRVNGKKSAHAIDVSEVSGVRTAEYDTGETKKVTIDGHKQEVPVVDVVTMDYNRYFIEHPEQMAGEMHFGFEKGDTYRAKSKALYPVKGMNQEAMLSAWAQSFSDMDFDAAPTTKQEYETTYDTVGNEVKVGSMVIDNHGRLCVNSGGVARPLMSARKNKQDARTDDELISMFNSKKIKGRTRQQCLKDYNGIKKALADVLEYQTTHEDNEGLEPLLSRLNATFDSFVSRYGNLHKNNQLAWLKNDVDYPGILALETYKERGDERGNRIKEFGKTDIFSRRVVEKETIPQPKNIKDGIITSLYISGRVDVGYISEQLGISEKQVREEIVSSGLGFENPVSREMEVSYEYLSGNVREKLRQATVNNTDGRYDTNIKALEKVVPMNIPAHLIEFTLGSSWIEPQLYEDYVKDRTGVNVKLTNVGGTWFMKTSGSELNTDQNRSQGVYSEELKKTIFGHEILEAAITNRSISVSRTYKHSDGTYETITDRDATQAVAAKVDEFRMDFKDWARAKMQGDMEMSARMETVYNDRFNNSVPRSIPDEFIPKHFGGQVTELGGKPFSLRPHQAKAVIRGTTQSQLLAHEVGTGKTFTLISTAMEMRRLGTARKPMIVVQNATVGQFVESAKALYPNAKVLTLEDADRNAQGRKDFYAKIRYNDWDMIVIPQSVLDMIPDSEERQIRFIQDKIAEKMLVLQQMAEQDPDGSSWITKQAEKEISDLEIDLAKITESLESKRKEKGEKDMKKEAQTRHNAEVRAMEMLDRATDDVENFDQMGIDALLVDEAHEYKHLGFATAMQRGVKGVDPSYSKKAQGLYLKTQAVMERNKGRNVIFATGTPISNTAAEIWTFMRYLMPEDEMREYGIYYFDDFVRNFGNLQQMLEFATNGKFKENNRFAGYVNLPELVRIWSTVTDTVLTREAEDVSDKIPDMEGGKAQDIYLPQTKALRSVMLYVKSELDRYDNMTGKEKKANSHIPLTMYGIAKAAAVDARLVYSDAADEPQSKTNEAVRQTLRSLEETSHYKGTVAIFADNYQNKQSGFNLYEDIRRKLIEQGVPAEQIVVMKSGMTVKKKLEIFDKVNAGEVRVILGSTYTLGTGVNIQERLHTLIHLDAPNRPMDYTQRNGRILRQGNLHKDMGIPVRVLRFGVEDSLDVTAYQRLKTKGAIADSIMNGSKMMENSMETRSLEEDEDVFGDITAQLSGSEYAMLKNQAEKEVRKLNSKLKQWEADQTYIHNQIPRLKGQIRESENHQKVAQENLDVVRRIFPNGTFKTITIGKQTFSDLESMNKLFTVHNKSVMDISDQIRDNKITGPQTRKLTIDIDGLKFEVTTVIDKEMGNNGANLFSKASRKVTYSCPELQGVEDVPVSGARLKGAVEDIVSNLITGKDYAERINAMQTSIDRNQTELQQIEQRNGKEFEYYDELEEAKGRLEEYTEKMKAELAEKEAKYADLDANVEVASDITLSEEDSEETEEVDKDKNIRFRSDEDVESLNDQFNNELQMQINGDLPSDHIYSLGNPGDILLSTGVPDYPIQMSASRLKAKSSEYGHDFDIEEVKNLVKELHHPIAVFAYGNKNKAQNIIIGVESNGKQFIVGLSLSPTVGGKKLEINSIRNVFPKNNAEWLNWISQDKLLWVDKEKIQDLIDKQRTILADVEYLDLDNIAKIVKSFDNPTNNSSESFSRPGRGPWELDFGEAARISKKNRQFIERSRKHMRNTANRLSKSLGIRVNIIDDTSTLSGRKRSAKGWFDTATGEISLVIPNHRSSLDVEKTILHEAVAHYGLRRLFADRFDEFLDRVYEQAEPRIKEQIALLASRNGWNRRVATEEYLASLAEETNFEDRMASWWGKIKQFFLEFLQGCGFDVNIELTDNELRYVLWMSYKNLKQPGSFRSFLGLAEKISMQHRLGLLDSSPNLDRGAHEVSTHLSNNQVAEPSGSKAKLLPPDADANTLFRSPDYVAHDRKIVADHYEKMVASSSFQFREAVQDSMLGLRALYKAVLGDDINMEDIPAFQNAYIYENRMSSANKGEQEEYFTRFMRPLLNEIHSICGTDGLNRRILSDYLIAKHGLERNEKMRKDAEAAGENPDRDFAGLCGLTGKDDWQEAEMEAQAIVDAFESLYPVDNLWDKINAATKASLEKLFLSGVISEDTYLKVRDMYEYYVPLRGFDETTSDEVYGYLSSDSSRRGSVMKSAEGRSSKAEDPLAFIAQMADSSIQEGNRNIMKQRFLNFVLNNPSDLVSVSNLWLEYDPAKDEWKPLFAPITPDMSPAQVKSEVDKFEAKMQSLAAAEPDRYKNGHDDISVPYRVINGNLGEHQILVKRNGKPYVLTVNGNPRAAQALNGLTNPNVEMGGAVGNMLRAGEFVNRQLSAFYTTRNPDFVVSNFLRDAVYSNCMTWVRESPRYALRFHRNFGRFNPVMMRRLLGKWQSGALDESDPVERMFRQFMRSGGETGYTDVRDIEGHKKAIAREMKNLDRRNVGRKAWNALTMQLDLLNRSVENCARFAAFVTSWEMGRSLDRSIYDAKEISVNFNKKGSGGKMVNAVGQTLLGKTGAYIGGSGRLLFVFWNAGLQGLTNFGRAARRHPGKFAAVASSLFSLGIVIPLLAQLMGGGDDDDSNSYYNLPEYVRRSNVCFRAGGQWVVIPLPIEYRSIYGLGELATGVISGNERYSDSELAFQMASQVSQVLPLDLLEGGGGVSPFIPSAVKPFTEAYIMNKGWTGLPVANQSPFNELDPEWKRVYQSADQHIVQFSRWLNEVSGGSDYRKGKIDLNPAKIEYMISGTFGGMVSFPMKVKKGLIETPFGDREFEWKNIPLANRVVKSGDERTANRKLIAEYYKFKDEAETTEHEFNGYQKDAAKGVLEAARRANFIYNSPEFLRYQIFEALDSDLDAMRKAIKQEPDAQKKKEMSDTYYLYMRRLVNALNNPEQYLKEVALQN